MKRERQQQIWVDVAFVKKLNDLRAKRMLVGKPIRSIGALTKEIAQTESFTKIEEEILSSQKIAMGIKYDKNL